jgi:hypothetical protein
LYYIRSIKTIHTVSSHNTPLGGFDLASVSFNLLSLVKTYFKFGD